MTTSDRLAGLVDRQIRRWQIQRDEPAQFPCIAFSRLAGAGGTAIARRVAEWLDYGFFGSELVAEIARQHHVQQRLVEGLDERVRNVIDRYVTDAFSDHPFTETEYLEHLVRTVATLGERGMAVLLGRGAPFILPADRALRVLVTAPLDVRVQRLARERTIPAEGAQAELEREDEQRRQFILHHFRSSLDDPLSYDLVLNTAHVADEAAVGIVVDALRRRFPGNRVSAPQRAGLT